VRSRIGSHEVSAQQPAPTSRSGSPLQSQEEAPSTRAEVTSAMARGRAPQPPAGDAIAASRAPVDAKGFARWNGRGADVIEAGQGGLRANEAAASIVFLLSGRRQKEKGHGIFPLMRT